MSSSNTDLLIFVQSQIDEMVKLLASIYGGHSMPDMASNPDGSCLEGAEAKAALTYVNHPAHIHSEASSSGQLDQEEAIELALDDFYDPANVDTDVDALMASGPSVDCDPDLDWLGMDPNISDTEPDQQPILSEADFTSSEEDFDSDDDSSSNLPHPSLMPPSKEHQSTFTLSSLPESDPDSVNLDQSNTVAASATDLPYVVQRLQEQLLSGYTAPNNPPFHDLRGQQLTSDEELSLKHYITWVDSRGTVKAYHLHAQVLQKATGCEILSLYMVQKLAIEVTGLSSRLVNMCPRSCMAFTGE
ncbi:hypothetical protein EI94DRAFT_1817394 [Lactarius quietus]|nr:hypothetical protein EI94DRAFT_1817394 [Lactarius quietus]